MFADTDVEFSETEFSNGALRANANTRDKLVLMIASIKRGIDLYYSYVGEKQRFSDFALVSETVGGVTTYLNEIDLSTNAQLGFPSRIDVYIYQTVDGINELIQIIDLIDFSYDDIAKKVYFFEKDWAAYYTDYDDVVLAFKIWYKTKKLNIEDNVNEISYDLNTLYIPEEVQRMLPYFVKGELYEEDEPNLAQNAKNEYIRFLMGLRKPFNHVQTHVRRAKIFDKTN